LRLAGWNGAEAAASAPALPVYQAAEKGPSAALARSRGAAAYAEYASHLESRAALHLDLFE